MDHPNNAFHQQNGAAQTTGQNVPLSATTTPLAYNPPPPGSSSIVAHPSDEIPFSPAVQPCP